MLIDNKIDQNDHDAVQFNPIFSNKLYCLYTDYTYMTYIRFDLYVLIKVM